MGSAGWWAFSVEALRDAGIDPTWSRIIYAICGAASIIASIAGTVFNRSGLRRGYLISCLLTAASLALLGVATGNLVAAIIAALLFGGLRNDLAAAIIAAALPFCPPSARRQRKLAAHICRAAPVRDQ